MATHAAAGHIATWDSADGERCVEEEGPPSWLVGLEVEETLASKNNNR
jgi:hypothetical protein